MRNYINKKRLNQKRIVFNKKRLTLNSIVRKGVCSNCDKKIGDEYIGAHGKLGIIKRTNIHHIEYHQDEILKDTIELCVSCHAKLHGFGILIRGPH